MMAPKTPVIMNRKGKGSGVSGRSDDKDGFIPEALYIGRCRLPTIFFRVIQLKSVSVMRKGKTIQLKEVFIPVSDCSFL